MRNNRSLDLDSEVSIYALRMGSESYCAGVADRVDFAKRRTLHAQVSIDLDSFLVHLVRSTHLLVHTAPKKKSSNTYSKLDTLATNGLMAIPVLHSTKFVGISCSIVFPSLPRLV